MEEKAKGYIVCENTLNELKAIADKETYRYNSISICEFEVDLEGISKEQEEIQKRNRWYADVSANLHFGEHVYTEAIKNTMYDLIFSGEKEDITNKTKDKIMNTKIKTIVSLVETTKNGRDINTAFEFGEENKHNLEYSYDIEELEEGLKTVRHHNSFSMKENEWVYLEKFSVDIQAYRFENIHTVIDKLIKRFMRENLTYCIKNNKVIVPEEYLAKGKEGIEEWRELKKNNNKNNSMEKRLLKQVFADKKRYASNTMQQITNKISVSHNWSLPSITVDGAWNKAKMNKLITKLANTKDRQKFIDMPKEEINNIFKEYWKDTLMDICKEIDKLEIEEY